MERADHLAGAFAGMTWAINVTRKTITPYFLSHRTYLSQISGCITVERYSLNYVMYAGRSKNSYHETSGLEPARKTTGRDSETPGNS